MVLGDAPAVRHGLAQAAKDLGGLGAGAVLDADLDRRPRHPRAQGDVRAAAREQAKVRGAGRRLLVLVEGGAEVDPALPALTQPVHVSEHGGPVVEGEVDLFGRRRHPARDRRPGSSSRLRSS